MKYLLFTTNTIHVRAPAKNRKWRNLEETNSVYFIILRIKTVEWITSIIRTNKPAWNQSLRTYRRLLLSFHHPKKMIQSRKKATLKRIISLKKYKKESKLKFLLWIYKNARRAELHWTRKSKKLWTKSIFEWELYTHNK